MKQMGLVVQSRRLVISLVLLLSTQFCWAKPSPESSQPQSEQLTFEGLINNAEIIYAQLLKLSYLNSDKAEIKLPLLGKKIVIDWGFTGSGDMFTPLPATKFNIYRSHR